MKSKSLLIAATLLTTIRLIAQEPPPTTPPPPKAILVRPGAMKVEPMLDPESIPLAKPLESDAAVQGKPSGDDAVKLQVFLDQLNFGPGVIDGKPGLFTEHAVNAWNEVNGHPIDDWSAVMDTARKGVSEPFTTVIVPDILVKWVNPKLPNDRILQSKTKRLSYRSAGELMAERYSDSGGV